MANSDGFKKLLGKLVKDPASFNADDVESAVDLITTPDRAAPAQIGAFLAILKLSGLDRTSHVLSAAARALMKHMVPVLVERSEDFYVDIVGTGGDGHNTFNVSTTAAIIAAGAGARVIKVRSPSIAAWEAPTKCSFAAR
jgi:anthranilate phosphoribosyltransferase